ncbi:MAG: 4Fe-4S dicluster domain-containing protein [Bacteroidota bacterium]
MHIVSQILFLLLLGATAYIVSKRIRFISRAIKTGKPENRTDRPTERMNNMLLMAFGQKKMFDKPLIGFMHFIIYAGFLLVNIDVLEIIIDGIFGTHRVTAPFLGSFYGFMISFFEILAIGVIIVCVIFLWRRNVQKTARFQSAEMKQWPRLDANIILCAEILMMLAFFKMNASDNILQQRGVPGYHHTGSFLISGMLAPVYNMFSTPMLIFAERAAWWFHIIGVMAFSVYVTFSKHLHIVLAFPNSYYARLSPVGEVHNMPVITREVKMMLGLPVEEPIAGDLNAQAEAPTEPGRFGAKDINDLSWKNLMDAMACTECGRCTAQCPANLTGKKLSPRKIMMDTRDRMEEVGKSIDNGGPGLEDGKSLYGDYITKEELLACTTCNACTEACPVSINPLDIIVDLRRYMIMEETSAPASWNSMFSNTENNMAPWAFPPSDRANWVEKAEKQ